MKLLIFLWSFNWFHMILIKCFSFLSYFFGCNRTKTFQAKVTTTSFLHYIYNSDLHYISWIIVLDRFVHKYSHIWTKNLGHSQVHHQILIRNLMCSTYDFWSISFLIFNMLTLIWFSFSLQRLLQKYGSHFSVALIVILFANILVTPSKAGKKKHWIAPYIPLIVIGRIDPQNRLSC